MSPSPEQDIFQAIADPTRRKLLRLLSDEEEVNLTTLSQSFSMTRPAISKHLKVLVRAGVVKERKVGRETRYKLHVEALLEVKQWLAYWEKPLHLLKLLVEDEPSLSPVKKERNRPNQ